MSTNKELSYEQAKAIIIESKSSDIYQELKNMASNIDIMFDIMFKGLEYAIETGEPIEPKERLQGGDTARLTNIGIALPYYLIDEKYTNAADFIAAYSVLCSNYYGLYKTDTPILEVMATLSSMLLAESTWSRLIVVSHYLTSKMEKLLDASDVAEIGVSRQFISTMLGEHIDALNSEK